LLQRDVPKTLWTFAIWAVYAGLVGVRMTGRVRGRKIALASIALLVILLATFWIVNLVSTAHRF
ncbi:MAG: c-type cytochrome biogenesis protein CcsB, partial [Verrucomicrobiae bacterium]|nr:c-type cytochrome biogenesis protein CcsB [Verrucomicrobiae bacterium]